MIIMTHIAITPETKPFWDGLAAGELRLQRCDSCRLTVFYPRAICPHCHHDRLTWFTTSGSGTVYAVTVAHRVPEPFADEAPYTIALVDIAEGARILTRVLGEEPVTIGSPVSLEITEVGGKPPLLPCYRPAPASSTTEQSNLR